MKAEKSKINVPSGFSLPGLQTVALASQGLSSKCTQRAWANSLISLLTRTLILWDQDPTFMTLFNFNNFLRGPISKYSHSGSWGFNLWIWGGYSSNQSVAEFRTKSLSHPSPALSQPLLCDSKVVLKSDYSWHTWESDILESLRIHCSRSKCIKKLFLFRVTSGIWQTGNTCLKISLPKNSLDNC